MLPAVFMGDEMARAGISMIPGIQDELKSYSYLRHTINLMPYKSGRDYSSNAVGEIKKNILKVHLANMSAQDNIQDYVHVDVADFSLLGTNKTFKNPAERLISYSIMKGISEAILNRQWFMVRNENGDTSSDLADGWLELIRKTEQSGEIAEGEGNLIDLGPITPPTDESDTDAYQQAKEFLKRINPALLRANPVVNLTVETAMAIQDAMSNAKRYYKEPDKYGRFVIPEFPNVTWNPNLSMGYGDKLVLQSVGNMMYGYDSLSDEEYIEASKLNKDRNIIDYWAQFRLGMQFNSFNRKVFATTTGSLNPADYEGDVSGPDVYTITASATGGTVTITPQQTKYAYGDAVELKCTPETGKTFNSWSDGSLDATRKLSVRGNITLNATCE